MTKEQRAKYRCGMQLIFAAQDGATEEAKKCVEDGADINFTDSEGRTILHWAAAEEHEALLDWVINHPKFHKYTDTDAQNKTALDLLRESNLRSRDLLCNKIFDLGKNLVKNTKSTTKRTADDTFIKATRAEKYDYKYKKEDINDIMEFFCDPLGEHDASAMLKREFPLRELGEILCLFINCENGTMFFEVKQSREQDPSEGTSEHDPTTQALLNLKDECELIANFKFDQTHTANQKKLTEGLGKLNKECLASPSKRLFFAAALEEKQRTILKAERCQKYLEDNQNNKSELTYKKALTLVLCLETLAAQDTNPPQKLEKSEKRTLKELKKKYYKRHFPSCSGLNIFEVLRAELVHSSKTLTLDDIKEVKLDWNLLWTRLHDFMSEFCQKLRGTWDEKIPKEEENKLEELLQELLKGLKNRTGIEETDVFVIFCKNTMNFLSTSDQLGDGDKLHQLLFDVLTIMGPAYKCNPVKPVELSELRNQIIHDFINESKEGLKEKIPRNIHILYRYLLARDMNNILTKERGEDQEQEQVEQELSCVLKEMNEKLVDFSFSKKDYSFDASSLTNNNSLKHIIKTYLMCLAPLRDCKDNDDDDDLMSTCRVPELEEISVLFKKLLQMENPLADENVSDLGQELQRVFSLDETHANSVLRAMSEVDASNEDILEEIFKGLKSIVQLHVNYQIPVSDLAQCVTRKKDHKSPYQNGLTEKTKLEIRGLYDSLPEADMWKYLHLNGYEVRVSILSVISSILTLVSDANELMHLQIENVALAFQDEIFVGYLVQHQIHTVKKKQTQTLKNFFLAKVICKHLHGLNYTAPYTAALIYTSNNCNIISTMGMKDLMKTLILQNHYKPLGNLLKTEDSKVYKSFWETVLIGDFSAETVEQCYDAAISVNCHQLFCQFADSVDDLKRDPLYSQNMKKLSNSLNTVIARLINSHNVDDAGKLIQECSDLNDGSELGEVIRKRLEAKLENRRATEEKKSSEETLKGHYKYGIPVWILRKEEPTEKEISNAAKIAVEQKGGLLDQIKEEINRRGPEYRECIEKIIKMYQKSQKISSKILEDTSTDCSNSMRVLRLLVLSDNAYSESKINELSKSDYEQVLEKHTNLRREWLEYLDLKAELPPRELVRRVVESSKYKTLQNDEERRRYLNIGAIENGWVRASISAALSKQGKNVQIYVDRLDEFAAARDHVFQKAASLSIKFVIYFSYLLRRDNNTYLSAKLVETQILQFDEGKQRWGPYHDKLRRTLESLQSVIQRIEGKKKITETKRSDKFWRDTQSH